MADDSDGEYIGSYSDDDINDHQVTSGNERDAGPDALARGARSHHKPAPGGGRGAGGGGKPARERGGKKQRGLAAWEEGNFAWLQGVPEDEDGNIALTQTVEADKRRRLQRDTTPLQRGIIRHLVLVLDDSSAMMEKDLLPNRFRLTMSYAVEFVREYFEQNPISQMGIVMMRLGVANRVSEMTGNPAVLIDRLRAMEKDKEPEGDPSLQNALEMCRGELYHTPSHGTREVLIIYGALLSSDPGDIHDTIKNLITDRIRVSMVGLAAQVAICAELCSRTNGGDTTCYSIAQHEQHFRELFLTSTIPPPTLQTEQNSASLLMMGFPSRSKAVSAAVPKPKLSRDENPAKAAQKKRAERGKEKNDPISLCACHHNPCREGYLCTRCGTKVCRLPAECPSCGLTLILSTHLARSYHHLFPLRNWVKVSWSDAAKSVACYACLAHFPAPPPPKGKGKEKEAAKATLSEEQAKKLEDVSESGRYACVVCSNHFCIDCDVFAHEVVHNCPGCQSDTRAAAQAQLVMDTAEATAAGNGVTHSNGAMILD